MVSVEELDVVNVISPVVDEDDVDETIWFGGRLEGDSVGARTEVHVWQASIRKGALKLVPVRSFGVS